MLKQLWAVDRVGMGVGVGESLIKAANGARQTDEDPRPPPTTSTTVLISVNGGEGARIPFKRYGGVLSKRERERELYPPNTLPWWPWF